MSGEKKSGLIKYGVCFAVIAVCAALYIMPRDFAAAELMDKLSILCDAFTIPGVVLLGVGGLAFASREGAMDGLTYALRRAVQMLVPGVRQSMQTYGDYVVKRRAKEKGSFAFLLISGGISLVLALIFLIAYFAVS